MAHIRPREEEKMPLLSGYHLIDDLYKLDKQSRIEEDEKAGWFSRHLLFDQIPSEATWGGALSPGKLLFLRVLWLLSALALATVGFISAYSKAPEQWPLQFPNWGQTLVIFFLIFACVSGTRAVRQGMQKGSSLHNGEVQLVSDWWVWKLQVILFQIATTWTLIVALLFVTVPHRFKVIKEPFLHWATPLFPAFVMLMESLISAQRFTRRHFYFQVLVVSAYFATTALYTMFTDKFAYSYFRWNSFSVIWLYVASIGVSGMIWVLMLVITNKRDHNLFIRNNL